MKKYTSPSLKVITIDNTDIMTASSGFSDESIGSMHKRRRDMMDFYFDEEEEL